MRPYLRLHRFATALALLALLAPTLAAPLEARAELPAARLARLLAVPGRPLALADARGRVPVTVPIPPGLDAKALGLLEVAPGIGAIRLEPAALDALTQAHPDLPLAFAPKLRPLLDVSTRLWTHAQSFRAQTGLDGTGVVVGVIDTGIDISHPDFRNKDGSTRIAWLLNAESPRGLHPDLEDKFGCTSPLHSPCAVYAAADIDALIKKGAPAPIHDAHGHGTHVTSIAAGNGGPSVSDVRPFVGVAPGATLVLASPSNGEGFFDDDVLNAARFIFDRADALGMPAVVNLSIGSDFGAHDGTSDLEKGLEAFVGDETPGHAIVIAAGNSGALTLLEDGSGPFGIHTEAHVFPGATTRIPLVASESKSGQIFVWLNFRPGDKVDVALEGPGGARWIDFTGRGEEAGYKAHDGTAAGVINNLSRKSAKISPDTNGAAVVIDGAWADHSAFAILLRGVGQAELWVVGQGDVGPESSFGVMFERATKQGTIAVPASAPSLLSVGCTINRTGWKPLSLPAVELSSLGDSASPVADSACYFSAAGPTPLGVEKPELSAPGGFITAAMSSEADPRKPGQAQGSLFNAPGCPTKVPCFIVDDRHAIASGTSMSAPHVAGAVALLFQRDITRGVNHKPTLTQARVTEILQAGARKPSGRVPVAYQLGPGELDLEGALSVFDTETPGGLEPSAAKSWYTLSSGYARTDLSFPVWGTVELRRADGKVASGIDGQKLALTVKGGVVVQPLVKIRHGMWRFAVAGEPGSNGRALTVDVTYAGASLGAQTLPIGSDVWNADGLIRSAGGCALSPIGSASGLRGAPGASFAGIALAVAVVARMKLRGRRRLRRG